VKSGALVKKIYESSPLAEASTQELLRELLVRLGEEPDRDGLVRTPERMQKSLEFLTKGYQQDPDKVLQGALFDVSYDEMVIVKDIEMFSLCEHHLLPFFGKVHVAYIPNGKVHSSAVTSHMLGTFRGEDKTREEFLSLIRNGKNGHSF
jgi:GTP cyclohydrolase I